MKNIVKAPQRTVRWRLKISIWVYDGDANDTLTIKLRVLYEKTYFSLGKDSCMAYTIKPDDKTACTIYHTPIDMMKGE